MKEIYLMQSVSMRDWSECIESNIEPEDRDKVFKVTTYAAYTEYSEAERMTRQLNDNSEFTVFYIKKITLY